MVFIVSMGAMILLGTVAACSFHRMEQIAQPTAKAQKLAKIQDAAMVQARWEANAKARKGVQP